MAVALAVTAVVLLLVMAAPELEPLLAELMMPRGVSVIANPGGAPPPYEVLPGREACSWPLITSPTAPPGYTATAVPYLGLPATATLSDNTVVLSWAAGQGGALTATASAMGKAGPAEAATFSWAAAQGQCGGPTPVNFLLFNGRLILYWLQNGSGSYVLVIAASARGPRALLAWGSSGPLEVGGYTVALSYGLLGDGDAFVTLEVSNGAELESVTFTSALPVPEAPPGPENPMSPSTASLFGGNVEAWWLYNQSGAYLALFLGG